MSKLYNDLITHEMYKVLIADLTEEQQLGLDQVMKEFTHHLESGLLEPLNGMAGNAVNKTWHEAYEAAVKDGTVVSESSGRPVPAPEEVATADTGLQEDEKGGEDQEDMSDG